MNSASFGDIPLGDYLRIVRRPRRPFTTKVLWATSALIACLLCTAAGDYIRPWSGKKSHQLSVTEALEILDKSSPEAWESELALGALQRNLKHELERVAHVATHSDKLGEYARVCLVNTTLRGVACLHGIRSTPAFRVQLERSFEVLRREVNK